MTPTVFGPDELLEEVRADLELREAPACDWLVGEWETERHYGTTRVVMGIGKAQIQSASDGFQGTNGWIDVGNGQVAQAHLMRVHTFPVWVHGYAAEGTAAELVAKEARRATLALGDQVASALRRTRGGLPMLPWALEVLSDDRGDFVAGSVVRIDVQIGVPIFDDPSDTGESETIVGHAQLDIDGTLTPATPETTTTAP